MGSSGGCGERLHRAHVPECSYNAGRQLRGDAYRYLPSPGLA